MTGYAEHTAAERRDDRLGQDQSRQLTLLLEIARCVKEGSQFIIVTHSPILLGLPGAEILSFDDGPVHPCTYEETDSYQVISMFINNREQVLRRLLEE